jgi:valyl-tRNA synthetase
MQLFMKENPEVLDAVMNDEIRIFPEKLKNTYRHWIENIRDWNISRQLWWGHRIPAWYDEQGKIWVGENFEEVSQQYLVENPDKKDINLKQDEDVLDTWFSAWKAQEMGFKLIPIQEVSTAMVIFQFEEVAAKLIFHPRRQANLPVWR